MSGALTVKQRLCSRGIPVDSTCPRCRRCPETICHVLFHCDLAKEVWSLSKFPLPPAGFSSTSVWLNMYHLLSASKRLPVDTSVRLSFPWIIWQIWKARNALCFERVKISAESIMSKATEDAGSWLNLQVLDQEEHYDQAPVPVPTISWQKISAWIY